MGPSDMSDFLAVHAKGGAVSAKGAGGGYFERRPSDLQELIALSACHDGCETHTPARTHMFARLKAEYLDEGLLEAEAETLARMALEAHCPWHILTVYCNMTHTSVCVCVCFGLF